MQKLITNLMRLIQKISVNFIVSLTTTFINVLIIIRWFCKYALSYRAANKWIQFQN
jgi:hypothetical protein